MRILGIDPGSYNTGYGIVETQGDHLIHVASGSISFPLKESLPSRLKKIYDSVEEIIEQFSPDALAIEHPFYAKSVKSLLRLGEVRGVVLLAVSKSELAVQEYSPLSIKKSVVGFGMATKNQVQHMVKSLLSLNKVAEHNVSDALAVAICSIHSSKELKEG